MIEVTFKFESTADAQAFLASVSGNPTAAVNEANKGKGRRSKKADVTEPAAEQTQPVAQAIGQLGAGATAADPLVAAQPAVMQPPVAPLPVAPAPAPAPAAAAPQANQAQLLQAFTALGQTKGRDAIAAVLAEFGVTAVIGAPGVGLQPEQYAAAIARAQQALQS